MKEINHNIKPSVKLPETYRLNEQFSDDFTGTSLDFDKWYDFVPAWYGRQPGYFDRSNVSVSNGLLHLASRELSPEEVSVENKARGFDRFSTAFVRSRERILYGFFEMRFKAINSSVSSAFWLNDPLDPPAKYRPGDFSEEIDIFEVFGKTHHDADAEKTYFMTLHRFPTPYVETKVNFSDEKYACNMPYDGNFYDDFHIGSLLWTPEKMVWYLDGEARWEQKNVNYHRPMYLNIDSEIMADWTGLPEKGELPGEFVVDYVRVWQTEK